MTSDRPKRHLKLVLEVDADTMQDLAWAVEDVAADLAARPREKASVVSDGYTWSRRLTISVQSALTGPEYREQLAAWRRSRDDE